MRQVLCKLEDEPEHSELVRARVQVIKNSVELAGKGHSGNPFARTPNRHLNRTVVAIVLNIMCQMAGINVITFYSNTILQGDLGYSAELSRIITSCLQTWQFLSATFAVFLIDRVGRRKLFLTAAAVLAIANAGLAGLQSHVENKTAAGCSLIFYFMALGAFPIGMFLIPFMVSSEIAPLRVRSQVTAMSGSVNWLLVYAIHQYCFLAHR